MELTYSTIPLPSTQKKDKVEWFKNVCQFMYPLEFQLNTSTMIGTFLIQ